MTLNISHQTLHIDTVAIRLYMSKVCDGCLLGGSFQTIEKKKEQKPYIFNDYHTISQRTLITIRFFFFQTFSI